MPFFSVLINAYNYGCYIEEAIQSAFDQSLPCDQFEVIVIDDGSTDDTVERIAKFGDAIRYFYQENAGQGAAFNSGISHARGEFVAFLDADDTWCPNKLEYIKGFLESNPDVDLVYHSLIQVDESGRVLGTNPRYAVDEVVRAPLAAFLKGNLAGGVPTSGIIYRLNKLKDILPVPLDYRICADSYLMITAPFIVTAIGFLAQPLTLYRLHSQNNYNRFDSIAGRYVSLEEKLLLEKLNLDLKSIEGLSSKLGLNVSEYCAETRLQLTVQEALFVRKNSGIFSAVFCLLKSSRHLKSKKGLYRLMSILFRLFFGDKIFNAVACKYIDSTLHKCIHTFLNSQHRQPVHD